LQKHLQAMMLENAELRQTQESAARFPPSSASPSRGIHPASPVEMGGSQFGSQMPGAYSHAGGPRFEDVDTNHDGFVDREEFAQGFVGYNTLARRQNSAQSRSPIQDIRLTPDKGYGLAYNPRTNDQLMGYGPSHPAGSPTKMGPGLETGLSVPDGVEFNGMPTLTVRWRADRHDAKQHTIKACVMDDEDTLLLRMLQKASFNIRNAILVDENYRPLCGMTLGDINFKTGQLLIMQFRHLDVPADNRSRSPGTTRY